MRKCNNKAAIEHTDTRAFDMYTGRDALELALSVFSTVVDANITAFLLLFIKFKPSAEVQLSILKLWLVDGDPGDNDTRLAFIVNELTTLYLTPGLFRK